MPNQLTRIETIVKMHTNMLENLTNVVQGSGDDPGLKGRMAVLEKHPKTCKAVLASNLHSWGLGGIYGSLIIIILFFVSKVL